MWKLRGKFVKYLFKPSNIRCYIERINSNQCQNTRHIRPYLFRSLSPFAYTYSHMHHIEYYTYPFLYVSGACVCMYSVFFNFFFFFRMKSQHTKLRSSDFTLWSWCKHFAVAVVVDFHLTTLREFEIHSDCELWLVYYSSRFVLQTVRWNKSEKFNLKIANSLEKSAFKRKQISVTEFNSISFRIFWVFNWIAFIQTAKVNEVRLNSISLWMQWIWTNR